MAEYINKQDVMNMFYPRPTNIHFVKPLSALIREKIETIPAADVRPVVTCADCKYNTREVTDLFGNNAIQCITGLTHRRDWFCADGKKREES